MAVVGAFARIDPSDPQAVRDRLSTLRGVTLFDLGDPRKVGMVIEADDMDGAHERLCVDIEGVEGVWGVWPVYAHLENEGSNSEHRLPC